MKILAVDDDMELLGLIGFALRQAGYLVIEASDGGAALAAFEREQPDLVLLDVNLPVLSGFEVCRRIRAQRPSRRATIGCLDHQVAGLPQRKADQAQQLHVVINGEYFNDACCGRVTLCWCKRSRRRCPLPRSTQGGAAPPPNPCK